MTLVFTALTPSGTVQVSDRRLTLSRSHAVVSDDERKCVAVWPNWVFGYTGLAEWGGSPTIDVVSMTLRNVLGASGPGELGEVLNRLSESLSEAWSSVPAEHQHERLLVHGAGLLRDETSGLSATAALFVGNCLEASETGVRERTPSAEFDGFVRVFQQAQPDRDAPIVVTAIGAPVTADEIALAQLCVKRWMTRGGSPVRLARLLGQVMDRVAGRYEREGRPVIGASRTIIVSRPTGVIHFIQRNSVAPGAAEVATIGPFGVVVHDRWASGDWSGMSVRRLLPGESTDGLRHLAEGIYSAGPMDYVSRRDPFARPAKDSVFTVIVIVFLPQPWPSPFVQPLTFNVHGLTLTVDVENGEGEAEGRLLLRLVGEGDVLDEVRTVPLTFEEIPGGLLIVEGDDHSIRNIRLNACELHPTRDESVRALNGIRRYTGPLYRAMDDPEAPLQCSSWVASRALWLEERDQISGPDIDAERDELERTAIELATLLDRSKNGPADLTSDIAAVVWRLAVRRGGTPAIGWNPVLITLAARLNSPLAVYAVGSADDTGPPVDGYIASLHGVGCSGTRDLVAQKLTDIEDWITRPVLRVESGCAGELALDQVVTRLASTTGGLIHSTAAKSDRDISELVPRGSHVVIVELAQNLVELSVDILRRHGRTVE
jgi:hypothetical protein